MKFVWVTLTVVAIVLIVRCSKRKLSYGEQKQNGVNTSTKLLQNQPLTSIECTKSAKDAFIENIERFIPLLTSLCDGTFKSSDWTDIIIDIDNDELTIYWQKAHKSVESWMRLLASWGLKSDNCTGFIGMIAYSGKYVLKDGTNIVVGRKYKVDTQCWVLTTTDTIGKVVLRGVVKEE